MIVSSRNSLAVPHIIKMCNASGFFLEHGWSIHRTLCPFFTYKKNQYEIYKVIE